MSATKSVLIAGESWTVHSIHQKGFDSFTTTEYAEGVKWLRDALEAGGWDVTFQPAHVAATDFPFTVEELSKFDTVILSDIGANTLLLHPGTFTRGEALPNRLRVLEEYVAQGGGLVMVGGYLTFQGIDAKAQYHGSAIEECLPVSILARDDRRETPDGITPVVTQNEHAVIAGVQGDWPDLLGYNIVVPKDEADVIVTVGDDPLVASWAYGEGRAVAFTSDCGPHWAPTSFVEWDGYAPLWQSIVGWAGQVESVPAR